MPLRLCLPLLAFLGFGAGCSPPRAESPAESQAPGTRPVVVFETDFGSHEDAPAILKGVVLSIARDAAVIDLTHDIPPFDIETGAQDLEDAPGVFPVGTVFVVVVDPGVGTTRKGIAVLLANGRYLVGPDNGVLSLAMERWGVASVREITNPAFQREHHSETFHGRDVFAPAGAHLAAGKAFFGGIGPEQKDWVKLPATKVERAGETLRAVVAKIDEPYGNVWTNVRPEDLAPSGALPAGTRLRFVVGEKPVVVPLVATFGSVKEGEPLAYWNSRGRLSLALNMGNAAKAYAAKRGDKVTVSIER
jgi:S-adenosylmethionine hydrolase